jgi:hypothetical protein
LFYLKSFKATSIYMGPLQAQALLARRRSSREESKLSSSLKSDPVLKCQTLEELLKEIGLEKYYPLFEKRGLQVSDVIKPYFFVV